MSGKSGEGSAQQGVVQKGICERADMSVLSGDLNNLDENVEIKGSITHVGIASTERDRDGIIVIKCYGAQ